jgi:hypothetical protein
MHVRRHLAALACAATAATGLVLGAVPQTAEVAHAAASGTLADQVAQVDSLLGGATLSPKAQAILADADTQWSEFSASAINPADYQCSSTELLDWLGTQAGPADLMQALSKYSIFDYPTLWAINFETDATPQYLGPNGELTTSIGKEVRDLRNFWDFDGSKIQLIGMHGSMLTDHAKMTYLTGALYGVDEATASQVATIFEGWVRQMPGGENNPYFTFNAFAFDGTPYGLPVKIIVGDGVPMGFDALGLDRVAMQQVIGHEYGHQVQFHDGLYDNTTLTGPEATRRTELMADGFGTYFLVHAKGEAINAKRVVTAARASYDVGDCAFTDPGHHGTPLQRQRTVQWAADLANSARPQGAVLTGTQFGTRFDAVLPTLIAPDAG